MFPLTFIFKFDVTYSQLKKKTKKTQNNRYIFVLEAESIKIKEYFLIHSLILSNFYFSKDCNSHCAYSRLKVIFILVLVFFFYFLVTLLSLVTHFYFQWTHAVLTMVKRCVYWVSQFILKLSFINFVLKFKVFILKFKVFHQECSNDVFWI